MNIRKGLSFEPTYWGEKNQSDFVKHFENKGVPKEDLIKIFKGLKKVKPVKTEEKK